MRTAVACLILLVLLFSPVSQARTFIVPDEFSSINKALKSAGSGDTIQINPGTYAEEIVLRSNVNLMGAGANQVIVRGSATAPGPVLCLDHVNDVVVSGITFEQTDHDKIVKTTRLHAVVIAMSSRAELRQCRFRNSSFHGINVTYASDVKITECQVLKSAETGLLVNTPGTRVTVVRSEFSDNDRGDGICVDIGAQCVLEDNVCSRNCLSGIRIHDNNTSGVVRGNTTSENGWEGIRIAEKAQVHVEGNTCTHNKGSGIRFDTGAQGDATENVSSENVCDGIRVDVYTTDVKLTANTCRQNGASGIGFRLGATGLATGNICTGNVKSGIAVSGWETVPDLLDNQCVENEQHGISFGEGCRGTAENNVCRGNKQWGVRIADEGTDPVVGDNTYEDNIQGEVTREDGYPMSQQTQVDASNFGWLLGVEKYEILESLATRLRQQKSPDHLGNWQLRLYYDALETGFDNFSCADRKEYLDDLERWKAAFPDSITPYVVLARAHIKYAGDARGSGWAYEVTKEGWKSFRKELDAAKAVLLEAEPLNKDDPEFWVTMMTVYHGQSAPREKVEEAFAKGIAVTRDYSLLYRNMAYFLLPRWHGEPGDEERFADRAVELTRETRGEAMYATVADQVRYFERMDTFVSNYRFEWPRLQQGFKDCLAYRPECAYYLNVYCLMACYYDPDVARELFEKIGNNWDKSVWSKESYFLECKVWVADPTHGPMRPSPQDISSVSPPPTGPARIVSPRVLLGLVPKIMLGVGIALFIGIVIVIRIVVGLASSKK